MPADREGSQSSYRQYSLTDVQELQSQPARWLALLAISSCDLEGHWPQAFSQEAWEAQPQGSPPEPGQLSLSLSKARDF